MKQTFNLLSVFNVLLILGLVFFPWEKDEFSKTTLYAQTEETPVTEGDAPADDSTSSDTSTIEEIEEEVPEAVEDALKDAKLGGLNGDLDPEGIGGPSKPNGLKMPWDPEGTPPPDWELPVEGEIRSKFGWRKFAGKREPHPGIDIKVDPGTPVVAPEGGKVVSIHYDPPGGGKMLTVSHPGGWQTRYMHLQNYNVKRGEVFTKGQTIAYSGNSGKKTTGPHLHYEVIAPSGARVDPLKRR